jgi:hypothetical protein
MSSMVNEINQENYSVATNAIRDILYMYYDLVTDYKGFGHNINTGNFDPIFFADCYLFEPEGVNLGIDVNILHEGSVVAILCWLSDYWDENGVPPEGGFASEVKRILSEGRLDHLPLGEEAIKLAFEDEDRFRNLLDEAYQKHVVQFFKKLADK